MSDNEPSVSPAPAEPQPQEDQESSSAEPREAANDRTTTKAGAVVTEEGLAGHAKRGPVKQLHIPTLAQARFTAKLSGHHAMSWRLFITVAILAGIMMALLGLYAWLTYPTMGEITKLTAAAPVDERVKAMTEARTAWSQQFITLAQTMLIGSLVPLLATITAYALGEKVKEGRLQDG